MSVTTKPAPKKKPGPYTRAKARAAAAAVASGLPAIAPSDTPGSPPLELTELGTPPTDPLAAQAYLHRMTVLAAYDAARDPSISPKERRKEIRTLTASAAKLMPHARLWQATQLIMGDRAELEQSERDKRGAKLVPVPKE